MHLKRKKVPKSWPIHRKGTTFVVRPQSHMEKGIPILIILRDLLKIAQNRKEVKKALHSKHILLNNKIVRDEKQSALLFDTLAIVPAKKYYKLDLSDKGRFNLTEISLKDSTSKIVKIIDKTSLKGKKTQLNLSDGRNFLSDIKCNVNDSLLINTKEKKIDKCLPFKEKSNVIVLAGKHAGEKGAVEKIKKERNMVSLHTSKGKTNVLIKHVMVVE